MMRTHLWWSPTRKTSEAPPQTREQTTSARRTSVLVTMLMGGICPMAILLATWRLNETSISDDGFMLVTLIIVCVGTVASSPAFARPLAT